jgi:hypothetical protein
LAFRSAARSYTALGDAAAHNRRAQYGTARASITEDMGKVKSAFDQLAALGYVTGNA